MAFQRNMEGPREPARMGQGPREDHRNRVRPISFKRTGEEAGVLIPSCRRQTVPLDQGPSSLSHREFRLGGLRPTRSRYYRRQTLVISEVSDVPTPVHTQLRLHPKRVPIEPPDLSGGRQQDPHGDCRSTRYDRRGTGGDPVQQVPRTEQRPRVGGEADRKDCPQDLRKSGAGDRICDGKYKLPTTEWG